jgi:hypothetical protein
MISSVEDPEENPDIPIKALNLRLDPEHYAALSRIARFEHLKRADTVRRLIRIADKIITGQDSPFAENLELLFQRKAG